MRDEFSKLAAFVLESNQILIELHSPSGPLKDNYELQEEIVERRIIKDLIGKRDINGLKVFQADFPEVLYELNTKMQKKVIDRLYKISGIKVGDINELIREKGSTIMERQKLRSKDEFHDLDLYWNLLKDENDNRQWDVEVLLGKYENQYDK